MIVAAMVMALFSTPASADGLCEKALPSSSADGLLLEDVGWCRLHEKGPAGQTVHLYTDQQYSHNRPKIVYVSYDRNTPYRRLLLDCETRMFAEVTAEGKTTRYEPIAAPLYSEVYESVCVENNRIILRPFKNPEQWPAPPPAPPPSL